MKVSHHAVARMNESDIDPQDIIDTIKNGIRMVSLVVIVPPGYSYVYHHVIRIVIVPL